MGVVSPSFDIRPGVACKLIVRAAATGRKKGQSGFKCAKGRGVIELKSEAVTSADVPPITFCLLLGTDGNLQPLRGPVTHDFMHSSVCGLPQGEEEWDFLSAVDPVSRTFIVRLEVAAQS